MKYRKKSVVVEVMLWDGGNTGEVLGFCPEGVSGCTPVGVEFIGIPTLEGVMTATIGDFIIRGVAGEFYPCKPDIFAQTYESVEERL